MAITEQDIDTVARTVYGEARGEGTDGRLAVAHVIQNRLMDPTQRYGGTYEEVCKKAAQFSCWNADDPNRMKLMMVTLSDPWFRQCYCAALHVICLWEKDSTGGSKHYHHEDITPYWAKEKRPVRKIGVHVFYDNID